MSNATYDRDGDKTKAISQIIATTWALSVGEGNPAKKDDHGDKCDGYEGIIAQPQRGWRCC